MPEIVIQEGAAVSSPTMSSPKSCDSSLINAVAIAAILLNVIIVLRVLEVPYMSEHVVKGLDVAEVASLGIGVVTLVYIAVIIKKNYSYEVPTKEDSKKEDACAQSVPSRPSAKKRAIKPITGSTTQNTSSNKSLWAKMFSQMSERILGCDKIYNGANDSAKLRDTNNSGLEMNCFFHAILRNMKIDNKRAEKARQPLPFDPSKYFGKDANGQQITFATASNEDYHRAAQKMRRKIGEADLKEWTEGGFATTTNNGVKTIGFYEKWALVTETAQMLLSYLPREGERAAFLQARRYDHQVLLPQIHDNIRKLRDLFPNLRKWNSETKSYIEDGSTVWDQYVSNKKDWYRENGDVNDSTGVLLVHRHLTFLLDLKTSLNPLVESRSRPQAEIDAARAQGVVLAGNTIPLLFRAHFGNDEGLLTQKVEWFSCLQNTLHENMGILVGKNRTSLIVGEECVDCQSATINPEDEAINAKKLTFKECSEIATALNRIVTLNPSNFDALSFHVKIGNAQRLWADTMARFGATLQADGTYTTPALLQSDLIIPTKTLKETIVAIENYIDYIDDNQDQMMARDQVKTLREKLNKIINNRDMVHRGLATEATVLDFLNRRVQANTQMSLLAINRASLLFKRTIVYSYPGRLPRAVNPTVHNHPLFFIHNSGNHWRAVKRAEAQLLYDKCKAIFAQANALVIPVIPLGASAQEKAQLEAEQTRIRAEKNRLLQKASISEKPRPGS